MSVDYYALLGVPKFCSSQDEIRRAYLAQARFFHPDAGNVTPEIAHQKMQELNAIYDTLRDPDAKRLYDANVLCGPLCQPDEVFVRRPQENGVSDDDVIVGSRQICRRLIDRQVL